MQSRIWQDSEVLSPLHAFLEILLNTVNNTQQQLNFKAYLVKSHFTRVFIQSTGFEAVFSIKKLHLELTS